MPGAMQCAPGVILVRPTGFAYDPGTAVSNDFQHDLQEAGLLARVEAEFDGLLHALDQRGVGITVLDPIDPKAPNAVFPNNWFSTHADGTVVLYPMQALSRRGERDPHMQQTMRSAGFVVQRMVDLSAWEQEGRYLEGTGSLVLDRGRILAFAALSPRTGERALTQWCATMQASPVPFLATSDGTLTGRPIYHTNVVMSIAAGFAMVCLDALPYPAEREDVRTELERSGKELITMDLEQLHRFVGNMLQVGPPAAGGIFLSQQAFGALKPEQRRRLEAHGQLVPVAVPTIEAVGGGSVRCMLAENFLPRL